MFLLLAKTYIEISFFSEIFSCFRFLPCIVGTRGYLQASYAILFEFKPARFRYPNLETEDRAPRSRSAFCRSRPRRDFCKFKFKFRISDLSQIYYYYFFNNFSTVYYFFIFPFLLLLLFFYYYFLHFLFVIISIPCNFTLLLTFLFIIVLNLSTRSKWGVHSCPSLLVPQIDLSVK